MIQNIKDFVFELGADHFQKELNEHKKQREAKEKLKDFLERQFKISENYRLDEEIDFGGLAQYISSDFIDDFEKSVYGTAEERETSRNNMIRKTETFCRETSACSVHNVKKVVSTAMDILYSFYRNGIDNDLRFAIGEIEEKTRNAIQQSGAEQKEFFARAVDEAVQKIEHKLTADIGVTQKQFSLEEYIAQQIENIKNDSIFPWFNESLQYREVFPRLFIPQVLRERGEDFAIEHLITRCHDKNCAILGDAGAGKSTLLRYLFAFNKLNAGRCVYIAAKDAEGEDSILNKIIDAAGTSKGQYLVFIDGIDEKFNNDYQGFERLISKLKNALSCNFWLGCRAEFYKRFYGENIAFVEHNYTILPWREEQIDHFIRAYSSLTGKTRLKEKIDRLVSDASLSSFQSNPFQLALLCFLAERDDISPLKGIYDLYERFIQKWIDREYKRGTSHHDGTYIINKLQEAAYAIYGNEDYVIDDGSEGDTAITDLLIIDRADIYNRRIAVSFYHRSIAAFFLAQNTVEAMLNNDRIQLRRALSYKLKDDVTNFIGSKAASLSAKGKENIKRHLQELYSTTDESDLSIKEQCIYFITRLGIDVSDFLSEVIRNDPQHPIMRLTTAYGCVLSEEPSVRAYALSYAKSIASESIDAITNRAWTVIYYGDVNSDPYTYQDDEQSPWKNAREARIKRFTKENPRKKDYRFRLFDIPLFYSFLKDREWNDISDKEFSIIRGVRFPAEIFNAEEIEFLEQQKEKLLSDYKLHL